MADARYVDDIEESSHISKTRAHEQWHPDGSVVFFARENEEMTYLDGGLVGGSFRVGCGRSLLACRSVIGQSLDEGVNLVLCEPDDSADETNDQDDQQSNGASGSHVETACSRL